MEQRARTTTEQPRTEPRPSVLSEWEFLIDFSRTAEQVKRGKIFAQAMVMFADDKGKAVENVITNASPDVERTVVVDAYTYLANGNNVYAFTKFLPSEKKRKEEYEAMKKRITGSGATFIEENKPGEDTKKLKKYLPYLGTNHTKGTYVYDANHPEKTVFYLHTSNFEDESRVNMVIKYEGKMALQLMEAYEEMHNNPPSEDFTKQLSEDTWLYVDSGQKGKSIILDKAVSLIKGAKNTVQSMTLFYPEARFADALQKKHEEWGESSGKEFDVISTDFSGEKGLPIFTINGTFRWLPERKSRIMKILKRYNFPSITDNNRWVHAKCLIVDDENGDEWLFIGSHNYSQSGVDAGTREWQILTKNKEVVGAIKRMFKDYKELAQATASTESKQSQVF